jgi:hypothetical protein
MPYQTHQIMITFHAKRFHGELAARKKKTQNTRYRAEHEQKSSLSTHISHQFRKKELTLDLKSLYTNKRTCGLELFLTKQTFYVKYLQIFFFLLKFVFQKEQEQLQRHAMIQVR